MKLNLSFKKLKTEWATNKRHSKTNIKKPNIYDKNKRNQICPFFLQSSYDPIFLKVRGEKRRE